jgi:hypothetical protein
MSAPSGGSNEPQGPDGSGGMRAPGSGTQRESTDQPRSRTDRANQNDEDIGSSASREGAADLDPIEDTPDVTGTTDALEE